jgi:hypothetical protein
MGALQSVVDSWAANSLALTGWRTRILAIALREVVAHVLAKPAPSGPDAIGKDSRPDFSPCRSLEVPQLRTFRAIAKRG